MAPAVQLGEEQMPEIWVLVVQVLAGQMLAERMLAGQVLAEWKQHWTELQHR